MSENNASQDSSHVSSPLSHFPPEQRGSLEFQRELNEISGTSRHPIDPNTAISGEAAANIVRIESSRRSESSSLHMHLDPDWSVEEFHSMRDPEGWKTKEPSNTGGGLIDFSFLEGTTPRMLSKEEAEAQINELLAIQRERKKK